MRNSEELINQHFAVFLDKCKNFTQAEIALVRDTFQLAKEACKGILRYNGDAFIFHALQSAEILIDEFGLSVVAITASFIHEAQRINSDKKLELGFVAPQEVIQLAQDLDKIATIDIKTTSLQVENFRRLIVSLSADPRVILIKLADRLEVMRSLNSFPKSQQTKKSNETLLLYAPLAHQLGLYKVKSEMEDLALRFIEPEAYWSIVTNLKTSDKERNIFIDQFIEPIKAALTQIGLPYEIKSRTKSVYSIWKKMIQQQVPFEKVYDVFAIRIIIDSPVASEQESCWKVYSIVTDLYTPNPKRLRDWISAPRPTGYESLHITVDTADKRTIEVQIRTQRMDEIAESGIAAHWKYKGVKQMQSVQQWLDKVKSLLAAPSDQNSDTLSIRDIKHEEIFVYTPTGDLRQLPLGATVLDFAFEIHTNVGSRCVGGLVNGKNTTFREPLKTGDVVEILTSKNQTPKQDWLAFAVTSKARTRIKQSLREEELKLAGIGKELLERRLKNWKLTLTDVLLGQLVKHYKLKVISDLYAQLAADKINLTEVKDFLLANLSVPKTETPAKIKSAPKNQHIIEIDDNLGKVSFALAKCCNPIFGDEIFGFVTIREGVKIHRTNCPNASRLVEHYDYRIVRARWHDTSNDQAFQAILRINGYEQPGLVAQISEIIIKNTGLSVRSVDITNSSKGLFEARVKVFLADKKQLDRLISNIQQLKGIEKVVRLIN